MSDGDANQESGPHQDDAQASSEDLKSKAASDKQQSPPSSSEDQMAQWEEALKNEDWGHQPC